MADEQIPKTEPEIKEKKEEKVKVEEVKKEKTKDQRNDRRSRNTQHNQIDKETWKPKTKLGKEIKNNEITDIEQVLDRGAKILEHEVVDILIPELETELLLIGQAKGKFGGGQRRVFKQTQKKTREGNKPKFATYGLVGNKNGVIGVGYGKSKETVPAREKSIRKAKLNILKIRRGCGSWACKCKDPHTIPFKVEGKCGSKNIENGRN